MIDLSMFRNRTLPAATFMAFLMNFMLYNMVLVMVLVLPVYLDKVWNMRPSVIGLLLTAIFGVFGLSQPLGGYLTTRFGKRIPIISGSVILTSGLIGLSFIGQELVFWHLVMLLFICGTGLSMGNVAIQTAALEAMPVRTAGLVAGIYSVSRHLGSIIASSILGIIVLFVAEIEVYFRIIAAACFLSAIVGFFVVPGAVQSREYSYKGEEVP